LNSLKLLGLATALAVVAGCATTSDVSSAGNNAVAFGSFDLIRNGHDANLGDAPLDRSAYILVRNDESNSSYVGRIGSDGKFAMSLPAGNYLMEKFVFDYRGENIESQTAFRFEVPASGSVYLGAIQLEATLESGLYGVVGTADRFTVTDRCDQSCSQQLSGLGLPTSTERSLMQWDHQLASLNR